MNGVEKKENIVVCNAREHNLKNISVSIPLNQFTCVIGPSGCGKSSLVYDTVFAESQRNFLESMSGNMYGQKLMDKPKVDNILNLRPSLNISQNYYNVNPRSTVGTITDIAYYLRALFALYATQELGLELDTNYFSPNNPMSCCEKCNGLGEEYVVSIEKLIPDYSKTLNQGGITYFKGSKTSQEYKLLVEICDKYNINLDTKISDLTTDEYNILMNKQSIDEYEYTFKNIKKKNRKARISFKSVTADLEEKLNDIDTPSTFSSISKYLKKEVCSCCGGTKYRKEILDIQIDDMNIADVEQLDLFSLLNWIEDAKFYFGNKIYKSQIESLLNDIYRRVQSLVELKLDYLNLSRSIPTLSGGEIQRVRLANQLSCSLSGIVYILDEPCKGLHYKNIDSVISASRTLIKKGNTLIAIEHNKQYISYADKIIELGPVGGPDGGYVISENANGVRHDYDIRFKNAKEFNNKLVFKGISYHNLKNVDVAIPHGSITVVTGVSGSGKSTIAHVIAESCEKQNPILCNQIEGLAVIKKVLKVNQQPIGKTPRSTVISYLGIYDYIRDLFASMTNDKDLTPAHFSMNVEGGRCECCQGTGRKKIELSYMPDSYILCPECKGKRFNKKVLGVKYKEKSITDILDSPIEEIIDLFEDIPTVYNVLQCMIEIGLGYLSLGHMSMNLSGGEAQRVKLAKCLGLKTTGNTLYILDEPTSGLSEKDIVLLEKVLFKLSDSKETLIIIDHNIEFISHVSDYLVDLGCIAGNKGGNTVIQGLPQDVFNNPKSSWFEIEKYINR